MSRAGIDDREEMFGLRDTIVGGSEMISPPPETGGERRAAMHRVLRVDIAQTFRRFVYDAHYAITLDGVEVRDIVKVRQVYNGIQCHVASSKLSFDLRLSREADTRLSPVALERLRER